MGSSRREERGMIVEGTASEFRSKCLSGEKSGFAGCRHTSRKAQPNALRECESERALRAVNVLNLLPQLLRGEPFDDAHGSLTARTKPRDRWICRRRWSRRRFHRQQRAAERKQRTAPTLGEQAEVADAREALGENMLQEPPQKLVV